MRIEQFQIVSGFTVEMDIVLTVGAGLKKIAKDLGGRVLQLSVPTIAPPDAPRALVQSKDTVVHVGLNRFEVITRPPEHINSNFATSAEFAVSRASSIFEALHKLGGSYQWLGVIANIKYPKSGKDLTALKYSEVLFDNLLKIKRNDRPLSSFQVQFGFNEDDHYKSYMITGYESRDIKFSGEIPDGVGIEIDVSQFPLTESGFELTLDHNNKGSMIKTDPMNDLKNMISIMTRSFDNLPKQLNLEEYLI